MSAKRRKWNIGNAFAVPTCDGRYLAGQIIGREENVLNSVTIALFDEVRGSAEEIGFADLGESQLFSTLFATRDLLDSGRWKIVGDRPVVLPKKLFPFEHRRASGFVGAKVIGSAIINEFVNAYLGLVPWDDWKDPTYLDKLLISPSKRPSTILLKSRE
jgi:hypothetical protein